MVESGEESTPHFQDFRIKSKKKVCRHINIYTHTQILLLTGLVVTNKRDLLWSSKVGEGKVGPPQ